MSRLEKTVLATLRIRESCGCGRAALKDSSGNMVLPNMLERDFRGLDSFEEIALSFRAFGRF
jgi:hypothetical protein